MVDIKGISPSIVQHRIDLIEEAKVKRDPQCRLIAHIYCIILYYISTFIMN